MTEELGRLAENLNNAFKGRHAVQYIQEYIKATSMLEHPYSDSDSAMEELDETLNHLEDWFQQRAMTIVEKIIRMED